MSTTSVKSTTGRLCDFTIGGRKFCRIKYLSSPYVMLRPTTSFSHSTPVAVGSMARGVFAGDPMFLSAASSLAASSGAVASEALAKLKPMTWVDSLGNLGDAPELSDVHMGTGDYVAWSDHSKSGEFKHNMLWSIAKFPDLQSILVLHRVLHMAMDLYLLLSHGWNGWSRSQIAADPSSSRYNAHLTLPLSFMVKTRHSILTIMYLPTRIRVRPTFPTLHSC
jgi:hypothetical protein